MEYSELDRIFICKLIHEEYLTKLHYCPCCNKTINDIIREIEDKQFSYVCCFLKVFFGICLPLEFYE